MNHSIITFRGPAALPGLFLTLTRVNRGHDCFFSFMQTGHLKAGRAFSPLCSISYQLDGEMRDYPIKQHITGKGWKIEDCAFRMWLIGRIDEHPACTGLSFQECCSLAWILAALINAHLEKLGHETVRAGSFDREASKNKRLHEIALILFEEFLRRIAEILLENMDLDSINLDIDNNSHL